MNTKNKNIQLRTRGKIKGKALQKRAAKRYVELHDKINDCLQRMDDQLLLVFKVMDYVSSIDNKLGRPVNNYYYTAKYSFQTSRRESTTAWEYVKYSFYLYRTLFIFKIYEYLLRFGVISA